MKLTAAAWCRPALAALGGWSACAVALAVAPAATRGSDPIALVVNQHEVTRDEFQWFMELERSAVFRHFSAHLQDGEASRERGPGGATPRSLLQRNTVARIAREKVEQGLFQELGLAQDIGYPAFLVGLAKANQEREQAASQP